MNLPLHPVDDRQVDHENHPLLYFGGCDYLRLSHHPRVMDAAKTSIDREASLSSSASRTTTGNHAVYESLEKALAHFIGVESARLTGAGYLANLVLADYLKQTASLIMLDAHAHPSLRDTVRLSGRPSCTFRHRDAENALATFHRQGSPPQCFLLSDAVFGIDGSTMPVDDFHTLLPTGISFLLDDAHGLGYGGPAGRGTGTGLDLGSRQIIRTLSLAKVLGCHGGAVAGNAQVLEHVTKKSQSWSGHTPFPMNTAVAASTSLSLLQQDHSARHALDQNMDRMREIMGKLHGMQTETLNFPVVTFCFDASRHQHHGKGLAEVLTSHGIYPSLIQYPATGSELLLRIAIASAHLPEDMQRLEAALKALQDWSGLKRFRLKNQSIPVPSDE